jgi:hypothetical protein
MANRKSLRIYVAGKVSKDSHFGHHYWRDEFIAELEKLSGQKLENLDPTKSKLPVSIPEMVFGGSAYMISVCDVVIVYLSDDISVGGSQEILIAKFFKKPVIALAPRGGKFNGSTKEFFGETVKDYKDPFVFTTCDVVCENIEQVARALSDLSKIKPKDADIIKKLADEYSKSL